MTTTGEPKDPDEMIRDPRIGIDGVREMIARAEDFDLWLARENLREAVRAKCERLAAKIDAARSVRGLPPLRARSSARSGT
jgi:hypothetical protein